MAAVSIVIPTLNEATCLGRTLRHLSLLDPPAFEIIVVDCGSSDATTEIAREAGVQLIEIAERGRARQMNRGAEAATGEVLVFLHADTLVPDDCIEVVERTLADRRVSGGGFISLMTGPAITRWGISLHNYLKTYYAPLLFKPHLFFKGLRLLFGDQVIFCRRADFWECGGFNVEMPILEEADLCIKLVKKGRIRQVNRIVQSSDRRVARWGPLKATWLYVYIGFLWGFGVSPAYLKRFYADIR